MPGEHTGQRSFGQLLDASFSIYFRNFGQLLLIAALIFVPVGIAVFILDLIAVSETAGGEPYFFGETVRVVDEPRLIAIQIIESVIILLAYLPVMGGATQLASAAHNGEYVTAAESLRAAGRKFLSLFWLTVVFFGAMLISFIPAALLPLLLVVPIYLLVAFVYAVPALMVEDIRGFKALNRSFELVQKFWWRTFGILLIVGLFVGLFYGLIPALIIDALAGLSNTNLTFYLAVNDILIIGGAVLTAPLWAAVVVVSYYDLRIRKEGFDLEQLVGQVAGDDPYGALPPPQAPAPPSQSQPPPGSQPPPSSPPAAPGSAPPPPPPPPAPPEQSPPPPPPEQSSPPPPPPPPPSQPPSREDLDRDYGSR